MPTFLREFGLEIPAEVRGEALQPLFCGEKQLRQMTTLAVFGDPIGIYDGRYVLYLSPPNPQEKGLCEYTLMPARMSRYFTVSELKDAKLHPPFGFSKVIPVLKLLTSNREDAVQYNVHGHPSLMAAHRQALGSGEPHICYQDDQLFDLQVDPEQQQPLTDQTQKERLIQLAQQVFLRTRLQRGCRLTVLTHNKVFLAHEAPAEYYQWYGLTLPA